MATISATLNPVVSVIRKSGYNLIRLDRLESAITHEFVTAIGDQITPDWATYYLWLTEWKATLDAKDVKPEVQRKRWSRLMRDCGVTIPKSDSPEAKQKQKAREEAKAKIEALDDESLKKRAQALKELGETTTAGKYEKALAKREEARKPETIVKNTLKALQKAIKTLEENPESITMKQLEEAYKALGLTLP
jgi:cysteinyl-tRNA synthetase